LQTLTGGYAYDRRMAAELAARGWTVEIVELDEGFPFPSAQARLAAAAALARIPDGAVALVDGLALGALPDEIEAHRLRLALVALVHHPLALETGLDAGTAAALEASERRALAGVRLVVATSSATAAGLAEYDVPPERIVVVPPGTDRPEREGAQGERPADLAHEPIRLLCVATLTPRKGHDRLIRALARLRDRDWRLTLVGSTDRDGETGERIRRLVHRSSLDDRVSFAGEAHGAALDEHYRQADVFVLPTFHEGYGMVVAEALAFGLPIVSTRTGGIPDLVGEEAGVLADPADDQGFGEALRRVVDDDGLRKRMAAAARRAALDLPTWEHSGRLLSDALEGAADALRFSAVWLALREPVDARARSGRLSGALRGLRTSIGPRRIAALDLGSGTGANIRALSPGGLPLDWLAVDRDAHLLAALPSVMRNWAKARGAEVGEDGQGLVVRGADLDVRVRTRQLDLRSIAADDSLFDDVAIVSASAFLDLASDDWLETLVGRCRAANAAVLFALTYDGRIALEPAEREDALVIELVNRHQVTDKGFGLALGPEASRRAEFWLTSAGYQVEPSPSDWVLGASDGVLQRALVDGWARAAAAMAPQHAESIEIWRLRRVQHVEAGRSRMRVGHQDIIGRLSNTSGQSGSSG
jgi:glycosyltransferase involved in cell wall biosynthesis